MRIFTAITIAATLISGTANAQQTLGSYYAEIGYEDTRNSSGVPLSSAGQILQQDRANFHRFGIRHPGDDGDPFFADRSARAAIPELYQRGPGDRVVTPGWDGYNYGIRVFLCGRGGQLHYIAVDYADGDFYRGCD